MSKLIRVALVAALVAAPVAPAFANGPGGGNCQLYWEEVAFGVKKPYMLCGV